jgi:surfactin synthase thioesterase subunit
MTAFPRFGVDGLSNSDQNSRVESPWLLRFTTAALGAPRVICLPHAGSGASAFRNLTHGFFADMEMLVIQYPGRETRLGTPPIGDLNRMAEQIADAVRPFLDRPTMLFGHSMGAKIAYELVRKLRELESPLPERLIVSCSPAPHRAGAIDPAYKGSDDEFLSYLRQLGGIPEELLEVDEMIELMLPVLRADFELLDRYRPPADDGTLSCPITAIFSPEDETVTPADVAMWEELTNLPFQLHSVSGGHFYFPLHNETLPDILAAGTNN